MAAAVADFRPRRAAATKLAAARLTDARARADRGHPRGGRGAGPARSPRARCIVGFAAETGSLDRAPDKLRRKGADLLVANDVAEPGSGFGTDTNRVVILAADGSRDDLPLLSKREVADRLLDRVVAALDERDAPAHTGATSTETPMSAQSETVRRLSVVDIAKLHADGVADRDDHGLRLSRRPRSSTRPGSR